MRRRLYNISDVRKFIAEGRQMVLTGDEALLNQLPEGNWIGGTARHFMDIEEGVVTDSKIFVDDFTEIAEKCKIMVYDQYSIKNIANNAFSNGFTILIIPLESDVLQEFGINSLSYNKIFNNPVVGYVAGDREIGAKVYNGEIGEKYDNNAVAIHIELPKNKVARAEILNVETIDKKSPSIEFPKTSCIQSNCLIDGKPTNISDYLLEESIKANFNIISDYNGTILSRYIKDINPIEKKVTFHSPIFSDEVYYLANRINDYKELVKKFLSKQYSHILYCCICMSYYTDCKLDKKKINIEGVCSSGEIAYHLLNRSLVFLKIDEI